MQKKIDEIKIGKRFRKELGNLGNLGKSIKEIGLIHPIVIDEHNNLIAGARRLEAFKLLGRTEISVNIINIRDTLRAECDENTVRKNFTPSESVAIWNAIEKLSKWDQLSDSDSREVRRKRASKIVGISHDTLSKAKQIVDSGLVELVEDMDRTGNVNSSYRTLQRIIDEKMLAKTPPEPINGKFRTIVIDPPWDYAENIIGRTKPTYSLMSMEELEDMDIMKYAEETCHLYIWTTNAFIWKAIELGKKWGFLYKTCITWCKKTIGLGSYFRNNTEHCLFFIKKGSKSTRDKSIGTWFLGERGECGEKPKEFYDIVERASYPPFLDIFARKCRKGWIVYGNIIKLYRPYRPTVQNPSELRKALDKNGA